MVIAKDFVVSADLLRWPQEGELTDLGGNQWRTPEHFYEETLLVFVNGVRVEEDNDDGYIIIDDETFEMKETYPSSFRISTGYVIKEV